MASRWFYRVFDQELGPVGFQDLAELVRAGTLTEEDRVRRETGDEWIAAREVIGLFRAAQAPAAESAAPAPPAVVATRPRAPAPVDAGADAPAAAPSCWRMPSIGVTAAIVAAIVLVAAAIIGYEIWSHRRSRVFPEPAASRPRPPDPQMVEAIRAPRPKVPSIPDLKEGVATRIPGLETIEPGLSPSLTADMKTIIFGAASPNFVTSYDLVIATRDDVSQPFGAAPKVIKGCQTRDTEAYCTISPDGLEVVFVRSDAHPQLFHAKRESAGAEFDKAVLWKVPDYDAFTKGDKLQQVMFPQFVEPLRVMFCLQVEPGQRKMVVGERSKAKSPFGPIQQMPFTSPNSWFTWFVSANGLRAYHGSKDGLHVAARAHASATFGDPLLLADVKITGPFDGPIWVAPQEDVVFYTSPGPGQKPGLSRGDKGRKLWMLRF